MTASGGPGLSVKLNWGMVVWECENVKHII